MALDGLVVRAIAYELQNCVGGRIQQIYQPTEHDIVFHIRTKGRNLKLLLSAHPGYPRVHLTEQTFTNPVQAPMFCMVLRKHCENGIIEAIEQIGCERILHIHIRHRDEIGDLNMKKLIVELMGRHSNIILVDKEKNTILDGIHHVTPAISSYRMVMPGSPYIAPPDQQKENPLSASDETLSQLSMIDNAQELVDRFSGISPLVAREIIYRGTKEHQGTMQAFTDIMKQIQEHRYEPTIVEMKDGKTAFSVIPLYHLDGKIQPYASVNTCLEHFYTDKATRDLVNQRVADIRKLLQNEIRKNQQKILKLRKTLEQSQKADEYRILGELLTASLHEVKRGDTQVDVINYYDPEQRMVTIPLDPHLTPAENAQQYFKKYNKSKNSIAVVQEQIILAEQEIQYMEALQQQLNDATLSDVEEIREELIEQGYMRDRRKNHPKKSKKNTPQLLCYTSSEGIPIYVGKNNTQNEYLTHRLARPSDTWLHTKDIPGSHVVIRSHHFSERTLEEAAMLASYYSQARQSSRVPVDYTLIRHVRKPSGAKPGFVIYEHQKTLYVTPDEHRIKQMKYEIR